MLLELVLSLLPSSADKAQWSVHLRFNSNLQLINAYIQKLFIYFNCTAIVMFFKIQFAPSASVFFYNLALYWKELKLLVFPISLKTLIASYLEQNQQLPVVTKQFQLYFYKLYIIITKSKSSASFAAVPWIFLIRLTNGA